MDNKSENVELAIDAFISALQVYSENNYPEDWAKTQIALSFAYSLRMIGNKKENFKSRIICLNNALKVYSEKTHPHSWATSQKLLGISYNKYAEVIAEHIENFIEIAIDKFFYSFRNFQRRNLLERMGRNSSLVGNMLSQ